MTDPTPVLSKREQILLILRRAIVSGELPVGAALPSENELRERYQLSRNTIREAVSVLVQEGMLDRIQGKGTFVIDLNRSRLPTCLVLCRTPV
jgi:DNA-binding GntR family transcriptional regulator